MTKAEACLWKYALRAGIRKGYGFRRQRPVLNFIADFMCKELMLVIEVDGVSHTWEETIRKDKIKEETLKKAGFHILRFEDESVLKHMNWVTPPTPSRGGQVPVAELMNEVLSPR